METFWEIYRSLSYFRKMFVAEQEMGNERKYVSFEIENF